MLGNKQGNTSTPGNQEGSKTIPVKFHTWQAISTWEIKFFSFFTFFLLLFVYKYTLCPGIGTGDSPEFILAGSTFGIPHPPGYPLYTLLSNIVCLLVPVGSVALRINFLSAIYACINSCLIFSIIMVLTGDRAGALFTGILTGLGITIWNQAIIAEVYTLDAMLLSGTMLCLIYAKRKLDCGSNPVSSIYKGMIFYSLACGHRNVNLMFLPVAFIAVHYILRRYRVNRNTWILVPVTWLSTFLIYIYLPIASKLDPPLDTVNPETFKSFLETVTASVYRRYFLSFTTITLGNHLLRLIKTFPQQFGLMMLFIPIGVWWLLKKQRSLGYMLGLGFFIDLIFIAYYRIPDGEVLLVPTLLILVIIGGTGASFFSYMAKRVSTRNALLVQTLFILMCLTLALSNYSPVNQRNNRLLEQFCKDSLSSVQEEAVVLLFTMDTVTHGMMYIQDKELFRPDVLLVAKGRGALWYQQQCQTRKPSLNIPLYTGPASFDRWPSKILERFILDPGVYLNVPVKGYFQYPVSLFMDRKYDSIPTGFMFRAVPRQSSLTSPELELIINQNQVFWERTWDTLYSLDNIPDNPDLIALILNYATYRQIFAEFAASHGFWEIAISSSTAISELNPAPLLNKLNAIYSMQGKRYVMSDLMERARKIKSRILPLRSML